MTTSGRPLYRGQRWSWVLPSCGILFLVGAGAFQLAACHAVGELKIATALLIGAALFSFVHDGVPEARRLGLLDS
jgi:hypothetical protein